MFLFFSLLKRIFLQFLACINHAFAFLLLGFKQTQKEYKLMPERERICFLED